jgi:hypothetical protein
MGNIGKCSVTCAHQGMVADGAEATVLWAHACMANQWSFFQKITSPKQSIAFSATANGLRLIIRTQNNSPTHCFE